MQHVGTVRDLLADECGSEIAEYALVLALFSIVAILGVETLSLVANNNVESDSTNFSNSMAVGQ
jgi:Flp pilus assembly pilin Flp